MPVCYHWQNSYGTDQRSMSRAMLLSLPVSARPELRVTFISNKYANHWQLRIFLFSIFTYPPSPFLHNVTDLNYYSGHLERNPIQVVEPADHQ